jgi:hypothetical protein
LLAAIWAAAAAHGHATIPHSEQKDAPQEKLFSLSDRWSVIFSGGKLFARAGEPGPAVCIQVPIVDNVSPLWGIN